MIKNLSGKLFLDSDGYVLEDVNISKLFDEVYCSTNKVISVKVFKDGKLICNEEGYLYKYKNNFNMKVYYINGFGIEDTLWDLVDKNINIEIWRAEGKIYEETIHSNKR